MSLPLLSQYDALADDRKAKFVGQMIRTNPREFFAELRAERPILAAPGMTLATLHRDVVEVLSRPTVFSTRVYASKMDPVVDGPFMLARDETPTNWVEKSVMRTMLVPDDLPRVRALAGRIADESLDRHAPEGRVEVVGELGRHVAVRVCGDYFGVPGPDRATMYRWSRATQFDMFKNLAMDKTVHEESVRAGAEMRAHLADELRRRRARPAGACADADVFDRLLRTKLPPGVPFDEPRILANMAGLLIGTGETTSQAIVQSLEQVLIRPEIRTAAEDAARAGDDARFDAVVWEALRFNPINPLLFRLCAADAPIAAGTPRATTVPAGTLVFACTASAMFDEAAFPDPDRFDPTRPRDLYLHFGYGHHLCLGNLLAGVIVPEVVKRVLLRPSVRVAPGSDGRVDFQDGPFPERFVVEYEGRPAAGAEDC